MSNKCPLNRCCHRSKDLIELGKNRSVLFQDIYPKLLDSWFEIQMQMTEKEEDNWSEKSTLPKSEKKNTKTLFRNEKHKIIFKIVISEKFRKQFCFFTCILPDYVFHKSPIEFWKNSRFENMRAGFLRRCQISLWQNSPEIMDFQAWKKSFWQTLCRRFWYN